MSDSEKDLKRELECLRLASKLTQMAAKTHNPDLKARFLRMARHWTDQIDRGPDRECSEVDSFLSLI